MCLCFRNMKVIALTTIIFQLVPFEGILALHLIEISVPRYKQISGTATLRCMYDLGPSAVLYSMKWYRNESEFYRYLPQDTPPGQAFTLPGISIDLADSDEYQVTVTGLTLASTGVYKCEVSTEAPVFHTVSGEALMTVIALPTEGPRIGGLQGMYSIGETVALNCTSAYSKPAPHLSWSINGKKVNQSWLTDYGIETDATSDLDRTTLGLRLRASQQLFQGRILSVRCLASLAQRTWQHQRWAILYQAPANGASCCVWRTLHTYIFLALVSFFTMRFTTA